MKSSRTKRPPKTISTMSQAVTNIDPMSSLKDKLKKCDLEVQNYVVALEKENLKFQPTIAKLQVANMTLNNRIKALLKEIPDKETKSWYKINQNFIDEIQPKHE